MEIEQAARILRIDLDEAQDLCDAIGGNPDALTPDDVEEMAAVLERDEDEDDDDAPDEDGDDDDEDDGEDDGA